jgi:hypothetical protein
MGVNGHQREGDIGFVVVKKTQGNPEDISSKFA